MKRSFPGNMLAVFLLVAVLLILLTPFTEPSGTFRDLDGTVGVMDNWDVWSSVNPAAGAAYAFGDLLCHQMFSRSLILNDSQTALCVRDLFTMIGMTVGLFAMNFISERKKEERMFLVLAVLLLLPVVADWTIQFATGYDSAVLRAITGTLLGVSFAMFIEVLIQRMFNTTLGRN